MILSEHDAIAGLNLRYAQIRWRTRGHSAIPESVGLQLLSLRHFIPVERSPFAVPRLKTQQPRGSATDLWTAAPVRWLVSALSRPFFPEPLECGQSTAVRHPPDFSYKSPCGFRGLFEPQL